MVLQKKISHFFKSLFCDIAGHKWKKCVISEGRYRAKSSSSPKKLSYNIYEAEICTRCRKILHKRKVRSNLNENQMQFYLQGHYGRR